MLPLPLFDEVRLSVLPLEARLARLTWSYSRRSTLEQCARRYYYEYFGASLRAAKGASDKEDLHFLKGLATRHERAGAIAHLAIAWYFKRAQGGQPPPPTDSWRGHAGSSKRTARTPEPIRMEVASQRPRAASRRSYCASTTIAIREWKSSAMKWKLSCSMHCTRSSRPRRSARFAWLVQHRVRWSSTPSNCATRVDGKVDLAYARDDCVTIVDWKMGPSDGSGDESLQLAVYALWALDHFGCEPSALRLAEAHLGSRDVVDFGVDGSILDAARARIVQDVVRMATVEPYGDAGTEEAFSPCLMPAICNACPFQRACPEGRLLADA
jgi:hypothetical protein